MSSYCICYWYSYEFYYLWLPWSCLNSKNKKVSKHGYPPQHPWSQELTPFTGNTACHSAQVQIIWTLCFSYIFERLESCVLPELSDSHHIMPSKTDGLTHSRGSKQHKKLPLPSITKFIYLVMRSIFCRRVWWKVGCPDWVSSHSDSSWKKCRSSKWLKLSQGMRLTVFCAGDEWGNRKKSFTSNTWACYQSNQKQPNSSVHYVKAKPTPADDGSSVKGSLIG